MATNIVEFQRRVAMQVPSALIDQTTIADRADIAAAAAALGRAASGYGLGSMVWHDLSSMEAMVDVDGQILNNSAFGWNSQELAWWHCRDRTLQSPLLRACRVESEPFWINRHGIRTRCRNRVVSQIALDDFEAHAGVRSAIVMPVHLPFGQVGGAILTSKDPQEEDLSAYFIRCADALAGPVERFVRGYVMVSRDERYLPADCRLTSREVECLNWIAHGKTDFEIGIILGCSHAGVRYHVTRACAKLDAVNRAHAVFRAAQLGLLGSPKPASH
jgi:DNA-binding CsgD family transcriptional regulator